MFPQWAKRFLIVPGDTSKGTWLDSKWKQGLGIGCKCCKFDGQPGPFGTYGIRCNSALQVSHLLKHDQSSAHRNAVAAYLSKPNQYTDQFTSVAKQIADGESFVKVGKPGRKIAWCLLQAMKEEDRAAIRGCMFISLLRDERASRLHIRFRCVNKDLEVHSGTLGMEKDFGTGASAVTTATERIMRRMCTEHNDPDVAEQAWDIAKLDTALFNHLRNSVLCVAVDSAADEVLSAEIMRSRVLSQSHQALTPNLLWVIRDKAHASRRLVSRPWAADAYIKDVALMMSQGNGSMARMIQNSLDIRRVFSRFVRTSRNKIVSSACTNMKAAKHRFESFAKPLGRTCIHLHATIRTALWMVGRGSTADRAKAWLQWLDTEKCLMAAMLADASDQSLALTRLMDNEQVDPASIHKEIHSFNMSITGLFNNKQCLSVFGYTKVMLDMLRDPILWQVGGIAHSIGDETGVKQDVIDRCLGRMRSWIILARAALDAEFPSWEIAQV